MKLKTKQHNLQVIERAKSANYEKAMEICHARLSFVIICICLAFTILILRLFHLTIFSSLEDIKISSHNKVTREFSINRASIHDRNKEILATNITTASLYANPQDLIDPIDTASKVHSILGGNLVELEKKFTSKKTFIWVKRHLTPKEQQKIHNLGTPGLYFTKDEKRIYPQTNLFAHAVGFVDIDGNGLAGIEKYFDKDLKEYTELPLELTLDSRVQNIAKEELLNSIENNQAIGGSSLVMDINSGEILAWVSLPDFNPHNIDGASDRQRFNQISLGSFEIGSVMKAVTTATALDLRLINVNDSFNVSMPLQIANFKIHDYKGKGGELSVPEILMYSSNIGTARIATQIGVKQQQEYLRKFGLLDKLSIEIPEKSSPRYPSKKRWNEVSLITISYGHGIAVTPLHLVQAIAAIANGGVLVKPTLLKHHAPNQEKTQVVSEETSKLMRKLLRLVVTGGSGKKSEVPGYFLAGKTGTAEKICGKGYCKNSNLSSYVAVYPIHDPRYLILVMIDEAKPNSYNGYLTSGGAVATTSVKEIVKRISPILGVYPALDNYDAIQELLSLDYKPRYRQVSAR
jgi:cell division protein FtsI (penicillin-binding protein 3)